MLLVAIVTSPLGAQLPVGWYPAIDITPVPRSSFAMVADTVRDRAILFGGVDIFHFDPYYFGDTWEWLGGWTQRASMTSPPRRAGHAMAYDPVRQRVLLTGGLLQIYPEKSNPPIYYGDTWESDGQTWQQLPAALPPRTNHVMTWHAGLGRAVVFGGRGPASLLADTIVLNGNQWQAVAGVGPPASQGAAGAYDQARARWVVFGDAVVDAWEFDGASWQRRAAAPAPSRRTSPAMAYDPIRQRVVLQGGSFSVFQNASDLWEWDGAVWRLMATSLPARAGHQAAWQASSSRILFYGGYDTNGGDGTVRSWDGAVWGLESESNAGLKLVSFGNSLVSVGSAGVFAWVENRWQRISPPPPNPNLVQLSSLAVIEDTVRHRLVVIETRNGQVQEFDGTSWSGPFACPFPVRDGAAVAFDAVRGVVTLFGGDPPASSAAFNDTWEWNGSSWNSRSLSISPSARYAAAMGFDPPSGSLLLHGGAGAGGTLLNDTWRLDAAGWHQVATATSPVGAARRMTFHEREGRLYMGGYDLWQWTGTDWLQILPPAGYLPIEAYDRGTARFALLGSDRQVWYFGPHADPSVVASGAGCGIGGRTPRLLATEPFLGNSRLVVDVLDAPPLGVGLMVIGTQPATVPLGSGCTLLVGGTTCTALVFADPAGFATMTKLIPWSDALRGATFHLQALLLDVPGLGLAVSPRLSLTLGD